MNTNTFLYTVGSACFRIGNAELQHVPPTAFNLSGMSLVPDLSIHTRSETLPWPRVSREVALGSRSTLGAPAKQPSHLLKIWNDVRIHCSASVPGHRSSAPTQLHHHPTLDLFFIFLFEK